MRRSDWVALVATVLFPVAARAEAGIYGKLDLMHFTNNGNHASAWFYGPAFGVYDDFVHVGPVSAGLDLRGSYLLSSHDRYRSALLGIRAAVKPPVLPMRPYVQGSIGVGGTRSTYTGSFSTATSVSFSNSFGNKFLYEVVGGLDFTLVPHLDLRAVELGYGKVSGVGSGNNTAASTVLTLGSGLAVRF